MSQPFDPLTSSTANTENTSSAHKDTIAHTSQPQAAYDDNKVRQANASSTSLSHSAQPQQSLSSSNKLKSQITDAGPRSSYYFAPPPSDSAFGTQPVGVIGRDKPREIIRIERDYTGGELCQFHPTFPLELEGRIPPTAFSELINDINVILIRAHDPLWTFFDNSLAVLTLYISPWIIGSKYQREIKNVNERIDQANKSDLNTVGLNLLYPSQTAFLFLEMEYF